MRKSRTNDNKQRLSPTRSADVTQRYIDHRRIRLNGTELEWCAMTFAMVPFTTCCSALCTVGSIIMRRVRASCCCVNETGSVSINSTAGSGTGAPRGGERGGSGGASLGCCFEALMCDLDRFFSSFVFTFFSTTEKPRFSVQLIEPNEDVPE